MLLVFASLKGPFAATHVASFVPSSLYDVSAVGRIMGRDRLSSHAACCASSCKLHARPCMQVDRMPESPLPCRLYLSSILLLPSRSLFFAFLTLTGQFSWSLIDPVRRQGAVHKTWKKGGGGGGGGGFRAQLPCWLRNQMLHTVGATLDHACEETGDTFPMKL